MTLTEEGYITVWLVSSLTVLDSFEQENVSSKAIESKLETIRTVTTAFTKLVNVLCLNW